MAQNNRCFGCMEEKGEDIKCPNCGWLEGTQAASALHLPPGTVLHGKYLLGRVLGQGGFGITYLAWDLNLNLKLAVKEYFPQELASRATGHSQVSIHSGTIHNQYEYGMEKFLQEARMLARFEGHPNIVSVRDYFQANETAYLVMNYIEGVTLKDLLATHGPKLPVDQALGIMMPVMDALKELHAIDVLHRDISPDNIYINKKGQVILIDFGAARQAISEQGRSLSVIIKPGYAPEEQYRSKGVQGPWTDIYSTSATTYHMITGQLPPESLDRLVEDSLVPPSKLGVEINPDQEKALLKALSVQAKDRFQSIAEFQKILLGNKQISDEQSYSDEVQNSEERSPSIGLDLEEKSVPPPVETHSSLKKEMHSRAVNQDQHQPEIYGPEAYSSTAAKGTELNEGNFNKDSTIKAKFILSKLYSNKKLFAGILVGVLFVLISTVYYTTEERTTLDPEVITSADASIRYNIESIEGGNNSLSVKGWAFLDDLHTHNIEHYLILDREGEYVAHSIETVTRQDVTSNLSELGLDLDHSGFEANIALFNLEEGIYRVGVLASVGNKYGLSYNDRYLVMGSDDSSVEILDITEDTNKSKKSIDGISSDWQSISVTGWGFMEGIDAATTKQYLLFKGEREMKLFEAEEISRPDVAESYNNQELNLERSGFKVNAPLSHFVKSGQYKMHLLITDHNEYTIEPLIGAVVFDEDGRYELFNLSSSVGDLLKYNIDSITIEDGNVYIRGWAFMSEMDNKDIKHSLVFIKNDELIMHNAEQKHREDVSRAYEQLGINLSQTGFKVIIPRDVFLEGTYQLGLYTNLDGKTDFRITGDFLAIY